MAFLWEAHGAAIAGRDPRCRPDWPSLRRSRVPSLLGTGRCGNGSPWRRQSSNRAAYTWSHALDNAPEQNNIDSGAFFLSDWTNRRHVFNGNALWRPRSNGGNSSWNYFVNNNTFAFLVNAQTGENFNMASNRVLNGDASTPAGFQRPLYVGRNTLIAPKTFEVNLRYSRTFPIKERFGAEFFLESTNIFNHTNVTGLNNTATVDVAGNITTPASLAWTSALDQRLIQFGLKFKF